MLADNAKGDTNMDPFLNAAIDEGSRVKSRLLE
jgi:hypothetical protein